MSRLNFFPQLYLVSVFAYLLNSIVVDISLPNDLHKVSNLA